jgi:hypothetical protein
MAARARGAMPLKRFWDIITAACRWDLRSSSEDESQPDWESSLKAELARLEPDDIVAFALRFTELHHAGWQPNLLGACYVINGSYSSDSVQLFLDWLIGMGPDTYTEALANPDSLAEFIEPSLGAYEAFLSDAAEEVWCEKTSLKPSAFVKAEARLGPAPKFPGLRGKEWDFTDRDEVRRRLPRLAELYFEDEA